MQVIPSEVDVVIHPVVRGLRFSEFSQKKYHLLVGQAADLFLIPTAENDHRACVDILDVAILIDERPVQGQPQNLALLIDRNADTFER